MEDNTLQKIDKVTKSRKLQDENKSRKIKKEQSLSRGNRNNTFNELDEENKEIYLSLFTDKDNYTLNEHEEFWSSFSNFKKLQSEKNNTYDFSFIIFPYDHESILEKNFSYEYKVDFSNCIFTDKIYFSNIDFKEEVIFENAIFIKEVIFKDSIFNKGAKFRGTRFKDWVSFKKITIRETLDLSFIKANDIIDLSNSKIQSINLEHSRILELGFLKVEGHKLSALTQKNFENKETARIVKANFEKMNNITEANKYFAIEQDLYINQLLNGNIKENNKVTILTTLYLNKLVSNFGTNWIRALLFLFMVSYLFMGFYINFDNYLGTNENSIKHFTNPDDISYMWAIFFAWGILYLSTYFNVLKFTFWLLIAFGALIGILCMESYGYNNVLQISNYMVQLTNPINAFKNMNLYEGIEIYGALVRITIVTVIYQLIVAFRQNTRRK